MDATQQIYDESPTHIIATFATRFMQRARPWQIIVAENEPQNSMIVRPREIGYGLDAVWNDDFHHARLWRQPAAMRRTTAGIAGVRRSSCLRAKYGFLYQGHGSSGRRNVVEHRRSTRADAIHHVHPNHDQVANSGAGRRLHQETSPGRYRALTALLLLLPQTPMLFQGQESARRRRFSTRDHPAELAAQVREGG